MRRARRGRQRARNLEEPLVTDKRKPGRPALPEAIRILRTERDALLGADAENRALRRLLAVRVSGASLYIDDGELQDNSQHPFIDYYFDSPAEIHRKLQERDALRGQRPPLTAGLERERMRRALHEIAEVWAGAECGEPVYAQEAYAIGLARRMYALAVEGLTPNDSFNELITLRADAERYREWRRAFREDVMLGVIDAEAKEIQNDYSDS